MQTPNTVTNATTGSSPKDCPPPPSLDVSNGTLRDSTDLARDVEDVGDGGDEQVGVVVAGARAGGHGADAAVDAQQGGHLLGRQDALEELQVAGRAAADAGLGPRRRLQQLQRRQQVRHICNKTVDELTSIYAKNSHFDRNVYSDKTWQNSEKSLFLAQAMTKPDAKNITWMQMLWIVSPINGNLEQSMLNRFTAELRW